MVKHRHIYLLAVILATCVFVFGLLLGNYVASVKLKEFKKTEERFLVELLAFEAAHRVFSENICEFNVEDFFERKVELGRMLTNLEKRFGKEKPEIIAKKEIYELAEINLWNYLKEYKEKCGGNYSMVLFFYTNKKHDPKGSIDGCEDQGKILDQVVYEHNVLHKGMPVYVFSFDVNSKNSATKGIIKVYNITSVPTLVINDIVYGYSLKEKINSILENGTSTK